VILATINRALMGCSGGGFVTACCARFGPDGTGTGAGHPAPYRDGFEVEVEAGWPLGIVAGAKYSESVTRGERFRFISDGVLEAANADHELFSFDRSREIIGKSAQEIAEAARIWGQNDDTTVVTVRRTA